MRRSRRAALGVTAREPSPPAPRVPPISRMVADAAIDDLPSITRFRLRATGIEPH